MKERELEIKSIEYRRKLLRCIKRANAGHTGGDLSCIDILNVLYNRILNVSPHTFDDPGRDRYVQSKGHCVEALYVVLADRGFFPESDLEAICCCRSPYVGHPTRKIPGIEQNTGALGHGLAFSAGVALAGKMNNAAYRVYTLLGDGELAEGSNWESMMTAAHYRLDNLVAIVDRNTLQITGCTEDVCALEPLAEKFTAFGWAVREIDGHDFAALIAAFHALPFETGKPSIVIARTVKGKGISFMENDAKWHHHVPTDEQYQRAQQELDHLLREVQP
ncbi:MAG: transketolase [Phycisphaerae bacterium]|nr:transketolase [Phycisphaerae bacterium]